MNIQPVGQKLGIVILGLLFLKQALSLNCIRPSVSTSVEQILISSYLELCKCNGRQVEPSRKFKIFPATFIYPREILINKGVTDKLQLRRLPLETERQQKRLVFSHILKDTSKDNQEVQPPLGSYPYPPE